MIRDENFKLSIYYLFRIHFQDEYRKRQKESFSKNKKRINFIILDILSWKNSSFLEKISTWFFQFTAKLSYSFQFHRIHAKKKLSNSCPTKFIINPVSVQKSFIIYLKIKSNLKIHLNYSLESQIHKNNPFHIEKPLMHL